MLAAAPAKIPVRRVGLTSEIAEGHSYLMKRTHATGQVLVVGGGASKMIGGLAAEPATTVGSRKVINYTREDFTKSG